MSEFQIGGKLTPMLNEKIFGERISGSDKSNGIGKGIAPSEKTSEDFLNALQSAVMETNSAISASDKAATDFATGKAENLHDVMIAMEKADISLRTLTAVRGKVLEAYQEIMRMQV
jgi:flagellar hook-basal body complex protein FliE